MRHLVSITRTLLIIVALAGFNSCSKKPAPPAGDEHAAHDHDHKGDAHDHAAEGPHGGHIIELGHEELHAELTHDEATHKIGVYLLGGDVKTAAPIEAASVIVNVAVDGQPTQYTLAATPQQGEPAGKSSYFELVSEPLCKIVCGESESKNTTARLSITIDNKPYVGIIETQPHEHDHEHAPGDAH
jgi:hypothetical protein